MYPQRTIVTIKTLSMIHLNSVGKRWCRTTCSSTMYYINVRRILSLYCIVCVWFLFESFVFILYHKFEEPPWWRRLRRLLWWLLVAVPSSYSPSVHSSVVVCSSSWWWLGTLLLLLLMVPATRHRHPKHHRHTPTRRLGRQWNCTSPTWSNPAVKERLIVDPHSSRAVVWQPYHSYYSDATISSSVPKPRSSWRERTRASSSQ